MKKNEIVQLNITDLTNEGLGIGRSEDMVYFVKNALIGDEVEAIITKVEKSYCFATTKKIIKSSPYRVRSNCECAHSCGGCTIAELDYKQQLIAKSKKVLSNLHRIGGVPNAYLNKVFEGISGMDIPFRYRNKMLVPFGVNKEKEIIAGFYAGRTHSIIPFRDCLIGPQGINKIIDVTKNWMKEKKISCYNEGSHKGIVRGLFVRTGKEEACVSLIVNDGKPNLSNNADIFLEKSESRHDQAYVAYAKTLEGLGIKNVSLILNTEQGNVPMSGELMPITGNLYITDKIGDFTFRISPKSFYQVNSLQTKVLYDLVENYASLTYAENVLDLYCGIGTIGQYISRKARNIIGIEVVPEAVKDAEVNASINEIYNSTYYAGEVEKLLPEIYVSFGKIDVVIVDPPRKGLDEKVIETIFKMSPKKVIYVSCDSATLSRDVKIFADGGYGIRRLKCVDMFPHTMHVECVVLLSRL